jgi:hypothetical protein
MAAKIPFNAMLPQLNKLVYDWAQKNEEMEKMWVG